MRVNILNVLFIAVTLKGIFIGVYHLYLPFHWQWDAGLTDTPEILRWTLFALNDMWSVIIVLLHLCLLCCFRKGMEEKQYYLGFFLAAYWLFHGIIISINPMPMPLQFQWLLIMLTAFPFVQSLILATGSWNTRTRLQNSLS